MPADGTVHGGRYTKVKALGKGSFGTVWLMRDLDGCSCVMKAISLKALPVAEKRAARNEVVVLQKLNHPHLVRYVNSFVQGETLCICMDYADGGDLAGAISKRERTRSFFPEATAAKYAFQLCSALAHCHHILKLLHRDIKPANCFLTSEGNVKLGDFGISKMSMGTQDVAQTQCGTPLYMSPEQCRGQPYSRAADVWAMGVVLWQMLTLKTPYLDMLDPQQRGLHGILRAIQTTRLDIGVVRKHYSVEMAALTAALLSPKVEHRPTMMVVLHWPILSSAAGLEQTPEMPRPAAHPPTARPAVDAITSDGVAPVQGARLGEGARMPATVEAPVVTGGDVAADSERAAGAIQRSFRRIGIQPLQPPPRPTSVSSHPCSLSAAPPWYGALARAAPLPGQDGGSPGGGGSLDQRHPGGDLVQQRLEELRNRVAAQYRKAIPRPGAPNAASPYDVAKVQVAAARQRSKDAEQARRVRAADAVRAAPGRPAEPRVPEPVTSSVPHHDATPIRHLAEAAPDTPPIGKGGLYPLGAAQKQEAARVDGKDNLDATAYHQPVRKPQQAAVRAAYHAARKAAHLAAYPEAPLGRAASPYAAKKMWESPEQQGAKPVHEYPVSAARVAIRADLDRISMARHKDEEERRAATAALHAAPTRL